METITRYTISKHEFRPGYKYELNRVETDDLGNRKTFTVEWFKTYTLALLVKEELENGNQVTEKSGG